MKGREIKAERRDRERETGEFAHKVVVILIILKITDGRGFGKADFKIYI